MRLVLGFARSASPAQDLVRVRHDLDIVVTSESEAPTARSRLARQAHRAATLEAFLPVAPVLSVSLPSLESWLDTRIDAVLKSLAHVHGKEQYSVCLSGVCSSVRTRPTLRQRADLLRQNRHLIGLIRSTNPFCSLSDDDVVGEPLRGRMHVLLKRPEGRRLMSVLTDGVSPPSRRDPLPRGVSISGPWPAVSFSGVGLEAMA